MFLLLDMENVNSDDKSPPDKFAVVIADLIKRQGACPQTLKKLSSTIHALFQKRLSNDELQTLLDELSQRGVVKVSDGKLSYHLPAGT